MQAEANFEGLFMYFAIFVYRYICLTLVPCFLESFVYCIDEVKGAEMFHLSEIKVLVELIDVECCSPEICLFCTNQWDGANEAS